MVDDSQNTYPPVTREQLLADRERFGDIAWAAAAQNGFVYQNTIAQVGFEALLSGGTVSAGVAADDLRALGYLTTDGGWTDTGAAARGLFEQKRAVRIAHRSGGHQKTLLAVFDQDYAIVVTGVLVGADGTLGDGQFGISYLPTESLVGTVMRWLGLSPAWAFANTKYVLSERQLEALLNGDTTAVPEEASPQLAIMAGQSWSRFSLGLGDVEPTQFVAVDGWGYFAVEPVDGGFRLHAMPTVVIYERLVEGIFAQLNGGAAD